MNQRGFDNQGMATQDRATVSAREAATLLGVKLQTLYAYASRGLLRRHRDACGRTHRYFRDDVDRLRARHDARAGHGAVAAGALRWGEPVLSSAITEITPEGPSYRGRLAGALVEEGASFESVCARLWEVEPDSVEKVFASRAFALPVPALASLLPPACRPLDALCAALPLLAARDGSRYATDSAVVASRAGSLVRMAASTLALGHKGGSVASAMRRGSIAASVAHALDAPEGDEIVRAVNAALVLSADHELNVSAFASRIAASAGADLYGCVIAALATLAGTRHGGACDRIEAWIDELATPEAARASVRERAARGAEITGFGHRLYPSGDPRAAPMLASARSLGGGRPRLARLEGIIAAAREAELGEPSVDCGLVALAAALGMPRGGAVALFAIGRTAGWIAHAMEQRRERFLLRPRARYVGPRREAGT